jgi:hypothetical protein
MNVRHEEGDRIFRTPQLASEPGNPLANEVREAGEQRESIAN